MAAILFFWKIAPLTMSGPIWPAFQLIANSCNNGGILWNMFFIDNFEDHGPSGMDYCFGWVKYLNKLGLVFGSRFSIFHYYSFYIFTICQKQEMGSNAHCIYLLGISHNSLYNDYGQLMEIPYSES
jgi:hypothetical protein